MRLSNRFILPVLTAGALALIAATTLAIQFLAVSTPASAHEADDHDHVMHGHLALMEAWVRATPPGAKVGGGYLTIHNDGAEGDRLTGGSAGFADRVEVHEMKMEGETMKMRPLPDGLAIPADGAVSLEPGGLHIMFMGLKQPLKEGGTVTVTLDFEKAGPVEVPFHIAPMGASGPGHDHGHDNAPAE
ncbi:copper chaperone PCu(A)C [Marivibrio halodurans]|uniref:Copper chaperone PCu(A)C n=1 Tax=Marivibrio halodurans TaxID=2039722 RepID=A0A8J7RWV3_9PROT|nr:copper chaperone PCu(A)C [Marivibrio halodurans]MBP5855865.1 copper chaperone PCu(A)C [Marivibrio halodurans]